MKTHIRIALLMTVAAGSLLVARPSTAQEFHQTYRLVPQTIYEPREVQAYRTRYETVFDERQVTRYTPTWVTETSERRFTVRKPVVETGYREERYTVQTPVDRVEQRERTLETVRWVQETSEREETYTVRKPVWETSMREVRRTEMRPVVTQEMRQQTQIVQKPVVSYQTRMVDMGGMQDQVVYKPGKTYNRLTWKSAATVVDPMSGEADRRGCGLYWTPTQAAGEYQVQKAWVPNVVQQQTAVTTYVPQQVVTETPVQVTRYEPYEVVEQVPYQACRWEEEVRVRKIPVTRLVPKREIRTETYPVTVRTYETSERVRRVPVTNCRWVEEERVEATPVQVCKMVATTETIREPRCVARQELVTYTQNVAKTVWCRIPIDACGNPISYSAPVESGAITSESQAPSASPSDVTPRTFEKPIDTPTPAPRPDAEMEKPTLPMTTNYDNERGMSLIPLPSVRQTPSSPPELSPPGPST